MKFNKIITCLCLATLLTTAPKLFAIPVQALSRLGIQVNYVNGRVINSAPEKAQQYGVQLQWLPRSFYWFNGHLQMFMQGGYERLHTRLKGFAHRSIYDIGAGPMFRYNITPNDPINFYLIAGSEPGYISQTSFGNRNLGIHFIFRDTLGAGIDFGLFKQFNLGLSFIHYSNLWFGHPNDGINLPLEFSFTYRF